MSQHRYSKQILFREIGEEGQRRLTRGRVALIGCGALGSHSASLLARAGVGHLTIIDRDFVELDNLQRQILFDERDVAEHLPKAVAAAAKLKSVNSEISVEPVVADLNSTNAEELMKSSDLVMDGTDNFETRFLINDVCVKHRLPWVYAGCVGSYGMIMPVMPGTTGCLRCALPDLPEAGSSPTCDTAGVLNTAVGTIASLQTTEAVKILIGLSDPLHRGMLAVDVWRSSFQSFNVRPAPDCPCCVRRRFEFLDRGIGGSSVVLCGRNAVQVLPPSQTKLDLSALAERIGKQGKVTTSRFLVRFCVDDCELTVFPDGRAIIKGTEDMARARSLYSRYIGS